MKRISLLAAMIILTFGLVVSAMTKADFSGTWKMDQSKSEGLPPNMEQVMTVMQTGDTVNVETKVISDQGDQTVSSSYVLDGKEVAYTLKRANGEAKGKRTAKWTADGNGFEVVEEEKLDSPNGEVVINFTRKWAMAADGTIVIELDINGPNGKIHTKRVFVKK